MENMSHCREAPEQNDHCQWKMLKGDEFETKSGAIDVLAPPHSSYDDQDPNHWPNKNNCDTKLQNQETKTFVFQDEGTQMKRTQLKNENYKIRTDNVMLKEALNNATCANCGGPVDIGDMSFEELKLMIENARLMQLKEIEMLEKWLVG